MISSAKFFTEFNKNIEYWKTKTEWQDFCLSCEIHVVNYRNTADTVQFQENLSLLLNNYPFGRDFLGMRLTPTNQPTEETVNAVQNTCDEISKGIEEAKEKTQSYNKFNAEKDT